MVVRNEQDVEILFGEHQGIYDVNDRPQKLLFWLFFSIFLFSPLGLIPMFLDADPRRFWVLLAVFATGTLAFSVQLARKRIHQIVIENDRVVVRPAGYEIRRQDIVSAKLGKSNGHAVHVSLLVNASSFRYFIPSFTWLWKNVSFSLDEPHRCD